jgi:hypothetical protein
MATWRSALDGLLLWRDIHEEIGLAKAANVPEGVASNAERLFLIRDPAVTLVVAEQGSLRRVAAAVNLARCTVTRRVSARIFARRAADPLSKGGAESAG